MKCKNMHLFCPSPIISLWHNLELAICVLQTEEHGQIHVSADYKQLLLLLSTLNIKCTEMAFFLSSSYASSLAQRGIGKVFGLMYRKLGKSNLACSGITVLFIARMQALQH